MTTGLEERRHSLWSMTLAFLRMDFVDEISYPASFFMGKLAVVVPIVVTYFVGELVTGQAAATVGGDYFTFAVIGTAVSRALAVALSGFGGALQRSQDRGQFETLLVEPVPWLMLPFTMNLWRMAMGMFDALLILILGWLLGAQYLLEGIPGFAMLLLLGIAASLSIGILAASFMVLAKRSQPIIQLYSLGASVLAGAVFSVDQLPSWIRPLSWLIPHTYAINSARDALMGNSGSFVIPVETAVAALVAFTIAMFVLGLYLFTRSLQYARKMGMLSGY